MAHIERSYKWQIIVTSSPTPTLTPFNGVTNAHLPTPSQQTSCVFKMPKIKFCIYDVTSSVFKTKTITLKKKKKKTITL